MELFFGSWTEIHLVSGLFGSKTVKEGCRLAPFFCPRLRVKLADLDSALQSILRMDYPLVSRSASWKIFCI
jgi:hypothetical protein